MPVNDAFLQELRYKTDIEDIVSSYVSLRRHGSTLKGLCPFHNEKTPSFTVYPETQSFYCFGCGAGGDVINFIKRIENVDFIDALKILCDRCSLQMLQDGYDDSLSKKRRTIYEANRAAAKYFNAVLNSPEGAVALQYYKNRGLTDRTIKKFGLGFAPDKWDGLLTHLHSLGFSTTDMLAAGLVRQSDKSASYYDIFRNRVMTPIIDVRGNVIAFGGRVLDDSKPKYINTGDTIVYKKTNELFSLNFAKDSGKNTLILCEGYMDVIAMNQAGFTNSVAGCGTALTSEQVQLISRYADEVVLAYDADEAGQKAVQKAMLMFENVDIKVRVPHLLYGKDPDEIIKNAGAEKFAAMIDGATNETEYRLLSLRSKYQLDTSQGKIDFMNDAVKILAFCAPIEQDIYLSRLSEELGIDKEAAKTQMSDYSKQLHSREKRASYKKAVSDSLRENHRLGSDFDTSSKSVKAADRLIYLLIKYPDCAKHLGNFDLNELPQGFYQKVFNMAIEHIENGYDNDLIGFSEKLSNDELSKLAGIIAKGEPSVEPKKEFSDCLKTISTENASKNKKSTNDMSDDEFRKLFGVHN